MPMDELDLDALMREKTENIDLMFELLLRNGKIDTQIQQKQESKSKRLNLLVRPSVYQKAKEKAEKEYMSVNELINVLLEEYVNEEE